MILSRDNRHMSRDKCFLLQTMSHGTATFILKYKTKVSVFLLLRISLTACNICQRAISQNIAHLHPIDLYGNIF